MVMSNERMFTKARLVLFGLAILGSCVGAFFWLSHHKSPDDQAQIYYERGVKLADQHDYAKAAVELRNALRLKNNMLPAWRALAQVEGATKNWDSLIQSLQSVVSLAPGDADERVKLVKLLALRNRMHQALEVINADDSDSQN